MVTAKTLSCCKAYYAESAFCDVIRLGLTLHVTPRVHCFVVYRQSILSKKKTFGELTGDTAMNIFRLIGDISHLVAIIILVAKIWKSRSCAGKVCVCWFGLCTA